MILLQYKDPFTIYDAETITEQTHPTQPMQSCSVQEQE